MMHDISNKLIDDLGGPTAVSKLIRLQPHQVVAFRKRGIPWRYRAFVATIAAARGIYVDPDFLDPWKGFVSSVDRNTVSA
jgi:hypothetical protein